MTNESVARLDRIEAIRSRLADATPGPWYAEAYGDFGDRQTMIADVLREPHGKNALSFGQDTATAEFVAHAPADVEWLLDLVADLFRKSMSNGPALAPGPSHEPGSQGCYLSPGDGESCRCTRMAVVGDRRPDTEHTEHTEHPEED